MRLEEGIAYLTAEEMAMADTEAADHFGIGVDVLMEKAGLATAMMSNRLLGATEERKVVCLVGKGNNGGDGLVAARYLAEWGTKVKVVLGAERGELRDLPAKQLQALDQRGIEVLGLEEGMAGARLIVDGLLGYSARGNPREPVAGLIRRANASGVPVLAVDLPSGLDASSGEPGEPCISAKATVTFGFPKTGFLNPLAAPHLGRLILADITVPAEIYRRFGMAGRPFAEGEPLLEVTLPNLGSRLLKDGR